MKFENVRPDNLRVKLVSCGNISRVLEWVCIFFIFQPQMNELNLGAAI